MTSEYRDPLVHDDDDEMHSSWAISERQRGTTRLPTRRTQFYTCTGSIEMRRCVSSHICICTPCVIEVQKGHIGNVCDRVLGMGPMNGMMMAIA